MKGISLNFWLPKTYHYARFFSLLPGYQPVQFADHLEVFHREWKACLGSVRSALSNVGVDTDCRSSALVDLLVLHPRGGQCHGHHFELRAIAHAWLPGEQAYYLDNCHARRLLGLSKLYGQIVSRVAG